MKLKGVPLPGYRIKDGKPVKDSKRLPVSHRIRQAKSKRVTVARRAPG